MVRIPPFSRVFEVLCQGVGLVTAVADGFSGLKSYEGKQKLFLRESNGVKQGLQPDLLMYLVHDDKALTAALGRNLEQYEHVFSVLRWCPIITYQSYETGMARFLDTWVLPQLAVLLQRFNGKLSARTPLYHFEAILVRHESTDMRASSVKRYVKSLVPETVDAPDFIYALEKISDRSHKKISTIHAEVEGLRAEISSSKLTAAEQQELLETIRSAYTAATALSRFSAMYSAARMDSKATLIERFRHHYEAIGDGPEPGHLLVSHIKLFDDFIASGLPYVGANFHFKRIFTMFSQQVGAISVEGFEPLYQLLLATEAEPRDSVAIELAFSVLEQHPDYRLFEAFALQLRALMALEAGSTGQALELFRKLLPYSEKQQLGHVGFYAASYAIALEVMQETPLPYGCQNPLINYRIESELQVNELHVALPTVFTLGGPLPDWPAPLRAVFSSIKEFNVDMSELPRISLENYCNPLKKLNGFMGEFFRLLAPGGDEARFRKLICKVIKGKDRGRSVMSIHTVTPYEALRDENLYAQMLFGDIGLYFLLNPHLRSYYKLPDIQKKFILKALSPSLYQRDSQKAD